MSRGIVKWELFLRIKLLNDVVWGSQCQSLSQFFLFFFFFEKAKRMSIREITWNTNQNSLAKAN